jgi:hypothetical protein
LSGQGVTSDAQISLQRGSRPHALVDPESAQLREGLTPLLHDVESKDHRSLRRTTTCQPSLSKNDALCFHVKGGFMVLSSEHARLADRAAVLSKAAVRSADRLGLTGQALARVLGLSEATVSRLRRGEVSLAEGSKSSSLRPSSIRAFRSLDAITGGDEHTARA